MAYGQGTGGQTALEKGGRKKGRNSNSDSSVKELPSIRKDPEAGLCDSVPKHRAG